MVLEDFLREWNSDDPYVRVTTSGSTGTPKEMLVRKDRMIESARMTCDFLRLRPSDTALLCLSVDYIAGKMMVVRSLHRHLRLTALPPSGHPLASLPDDCRFDLAAMVPLQVANSLDIPDERLRLFRIRHLIIGGGPVDDALADALRDAPNAVWSSYGMTETLSHIALRRVNGPQRSDWYMPFDGISVHTDRNQCLVIDAPQLCDTQLVTNDRAELRTIQSDGRPLCQFRILGRRDNVICNGGMKFQIEELEAQLRPSSMLLSLLPHLMTPDSARLSYCSPKATTSTPFDSSAHGHSTGSPFRDVSSMLRTSRSRRPENPHARRLGESRIPTCKKTLTRKRVKVLFLVVLPGLEPGQTVPKTVVLPLHHKTIRWATLNRQVTLALRLETDAPAQMRRKDSDFYYLASSRK